MVDVEGFSFFFSFFELALVGVVFGDEISCSVEFVLGEVADVVFVGIPLIDSLSLLETFHELAFVERYGTVDFTSFSIGEIVNPVTFVEEFGSGELTIAVGLILFDISTIETAIVFDEKSLVTFSDAIAKTSFVERAVIVDDSSKTMRKSIFPISFIVGCEFEEIIQSQFDSFLLGIVRSS